MTRAKLSGAFRSLGASVLAIVAAAHPGVALGQAKTAENAVTSSDDAFGTSVGLESTGIYSDQDTRGFSPAKAGNVRVDGIYIDPVASVSFRLRTGNAIRVGYAALDYPFPAPTGIVDNKLRTSADKFHAGLGLHMVNYGSRLIDLDMQFPIAGPNFGAALGFANGNAKAVDGTTSQNYAMAFKPVVRTGGVEFSPFVTLSLTHKATARPVIVLGGQFIPQLPEAKHYYGSGWTQNNNDSLTSGGTLKAAVNSRLSLRAGLFRSSILRKTNFTETFVVSDVAGHASHRVIADPRQNLRSLSGEGQLAYRFGSGEWQHRLIAGYRFRDRRTESGGSDFTPVDAATLGVRVDTPQQAFRFSPVNVGTVHQSSLMLGYLGKLASVGQVNLGLQRTSFRGEFTDRLGTSRASERHWLYNASLGVDLTGSLRLFGGTARGLEDSGAAPENAVNRNEQLPPTRSTQYEAGLRWKFDQAQLVLSAFQIAKPYFSFDQAGRFTQLGTVRHRGVEASLSGHFGKRLFLLAGAVVMKPEVSVAESLTATVGKRPPGTASTYARLDANYRTDLFGGLTPTLSITYQGRRAASSRPLAGGGQLMLPAFVPIDVGLRQPLRLGKVPASIRLLVQNINDAKAWKVLASNTLQPEDRRRVTAEIVFDF